MTWSFARQINLTFGRRSHGCTNIPLAAVGLRRTRPFWHTDFQAMSLHGSSTWIRQD
ncbi:MAG: hypothetical protein WB500_00740 [Rhodoplanes sp.]